MEPSEAIAILDRNGSGAASEWERTRASAIFLFDLRHKDCRTMFGRIRKRADPTPLVGGNVYVMSFLPTLNQLRWANDQAGPLESGKTFQDYYVSIGAYWFRRRAVVKDLN